MNQPDNQRRESGETEHDEEPLVDSDMLAFEERVGAALRDEAEEAAAQLQRPLSADRAELESEWARTSASSVPSIDGEAFAASLQDTWQREAADTNIETVAAMDTGGPTGRTAWLPSSGAKSTVSPIHWLAGSWWAAAAAAAILAGAVGLFLMPDGDDGHPSTAPNEPATRAATYLGADGHASPGPNGEVSERGETTAPRVLPHTVDFSEGGTIEGSFRIEIYEASPKRKIDDRASETITTTIYEPRWTCSETQRAELPDVFWFEVYRSTDPPGAPKVFSEMFARQ